MGRAIEYFATRQDSLELLLALEEKSPLYYVRWGYYPSPTAPVYSSASEIPDLGAPTRPERGSDRYFVFPRWVPLLFRELRSGTEFETVPPKNVTWVHMHGGGQYGGECLVEGIIETALSDRDGLVLFEQIARAIRKRFTRVESNSMGSSYVGPEALGLLRGRRLRFVRNSLSSPRSMDFKLPRVWRAAETVADPSDE